MEIEIIHKLPDFLRSGSFPSVLRSVPACTTTLEGATHLSVSPWLSVNAHGSCLVVSIGHSHPLPPLHRYVLAQKYGQW